MFKFNDLNTHLLYIIKIWLLKQKDEYDHTSGQTLCCVIDVMIHELIRLCNQEANPLTDNINLNTSGKTIFSFTKYDIFKVNHNYWDLVTI